MTDYSPISRDSQQRGNEDYQEDFLSLTNSLAQCPRKCCTQKTLKRRLPILEWLPKYTFSTLIYDIVAGISVGLTVIPQGIAYAVVSGLPPQYGLYSSFMGCFVYTIFGSGKDVSIGPTAIMSLMIYPIVVDWGLDFAILCNFLCGCIILCFGILHLGFLIRLISLPTIVAFTSAASIIIASSQVKSLLGIKSGSGGGFIQAWKNVFEHLNEIKYTDTLFGFFSLVFLMLLKNPKPLTRWPIFKKYISISRNAIVVITGMIIAYVFYVNGQEPFGLTGEIAKGLPHFKVPPFETKLNGTDYNFTEMAHVFGLSLITIPLVSILEIIAISKAFSKGKIVDATQQMIVLGLCNIASSFFQSIPVTGSFTRTAVNYNSGVRTPFGGVFTGIVVLLALGLLTGTFYFIPKTVLAAVVIAAMISMIEFHEIKEIYRTKCFDFIPFFVTFMLSLIFGLEFGILSGVLVNAAIMMIMTSRPNINFQIEKVNGMEVLIVNLDQSLNYLSAEYFKSEVIKKVNTEFSSAEYLVIDGMSINYTVDVTVVKNLVSLVEDLKICNKHVCFWNWRKDAFHLFMRYNRDYCELFKSGTSLCEIIGLKINEEQRDLSDVATEK